MCRFFPIVGITVLHDLHLAESADILEPWREGRL